MSIFKIVGSVLDVSGEVGTLLLQQVRYIRAECIPEARATWARVSGGMPWDKVSLIPGGNRAAQAIGSAHAYDAAADKLDPIRNARSIRAMQRGGVDYQRHLIRLDEVRASRARAKFLRAFA
jgi:hypothetical protein